MDFTETINLFETAFRKIGLDSGEAFEMAFLDRAYDFNKKFTSMLTLDPNEIMNYQARFGAMSNSMGVVGETALNISSAFTALGADIASLFNIDIPVAMQKLQSGLAGQIRPLRDIGVDISKTSIAQTALNYGITESIEKMSAATKVQLRFLTTIRQMRLAMTDMARTINNPANQLRILQEQWRLMARAFGNIFLPVVARVLPYLNAVLIAITRIMNRIASAFGFKLPSFKETPIYMGDIPDPMEGLEDDPFDPISSGAGNATDKVKELKKALAGFDELNVLNLSDTPSDSGGGGGGGSGGYGMGTGSGYGILDEAIADEWFNYQEAISSAFDEMANKAKGVAEDIYNSLKKFEPFFKGVWQGLKDIWEIAKTVYNIALKPLLDWMGQWIADNPKFMEVLGRIQGWVWGMIGIAAAFKLAWGGVNFLAKITGLSTIAKLLFGGKVAGTATTMTAGKGILGGLTSLAGMTAGSLPLLPLLVGAAATVFVVELISITSEEWNESGVGEYVQQQGEIRTKQHLPNLGKRTTEEKVEILNPKQLETYERLLKYNVPAALQYLEAMTKDKLTKVEQRTIAHQHQQLNEFRRIEKGIITTGNAHLTLPDKVKTAMGGADSTIMGTNTSNWGKHLTEWTGGVQTKTKSAMDNVANSVGTGTSKALDEFGRLKNQSLILTEGMSTSLKTSATKAGSSVSSGIKSGTDQATRNTDTWARAMPGVMNMLGSSLLSTATSSGRNIPKGLAVGQNTAGGNMTSWTGGLLTQFSSLGGGLDRIMVGSSKAWSGAFVNNLSVLYNNLRAFARMIGVTLPYYWSPSYSRVSVSYSPTTSSGIKDNRLNISAWASGGQPPIGQLFYAREAGAELVGNVGGRTTVMNNDQIVESVATGVANAVASVLGGGTNQPIVVQVGSDTLVDTVINGLNRRSRAVGSPVALGV
jgi:hypothetical protein